MDSTTTTVGGVDVAPVATTVTHSSRSTSTVVYPVACSLPVVVTSSSAAAAVAVDESSDLLHRRRTHLISRLTLAGITDIPALVATIAVTSVSSSFRLISPSESAAHDIDLVTLVRRSWFGELHRDASGGPSSVKFRFPLLSVTPAAAPLATSEVSEVATPPPSPAPRRNREHGTVVCVVHRSGYVALHTTACVEDIGPIAQYVHNQLRPHVCAPGAGSEVEHSIASPVPEGLSLHHFGADISLPAALLLLVSQQHYAGAATPASLKHHHRAATTKSATTAAAWGLPVRKLREACHRLWPSPLATTHEHHQPQHHAAAGMGQQKATDTREEARKGAGGGRHSKRQREEDDATSVTFAPGGGPPKSSGAQRRGALLLRQTSKSVSMPSSASSLFGEDGLTPNKNMEYMTFGASVAPTGRGNWMSGEYATHQDTRHNSNNSARSGVGVGGDDDGDAMLTALFQQHSAMLSISDAFQFASVLDTTATDADGGEHDRGVTSCGDATVCQPNSSSVAIASQQPGDQLLSTEYKDRYHVTVLPSREEHKELRLLFTPLHPDGWLEQQQRATGGSNVAASRVRNGRNGDKLSSSAHHNEVTLSFSHTGHVKVVRAAALPLVASVLQYAVMPLLLDVLVLGG